MSGVASARTFFQARRLALAEWDRVNGGIWGFPLERAALLTSTIVFADGPSPILRECRDLAALGLRTRTGKDVRLLLPGGGGEDLLRYFLRVAAYCHVWRPRSELVVMLSKDDFDSICLGRCSFKVVNVVSSLHGYILFPPPFSFVAPAALFYAKVSTAAVPRFGACPVRTSVPPALRLPVPSALRCPPRLGARPVRTSVPVPSALRCPSRPHFGARPIQTSVLVLHFGARPALRCPSSSHLTLVPDQDHTVACAILRHPRVEAGLLSS
ncbi:hypothetical protein B0H13DRAFT_2319941 [Mycena leptocephala]|nr:hypothetical protein B0H13DRAFT_2319941 [Mycena leptocephala]